MLYSEHCSTLQFVAGAKRDLRERKEEGFSNVACAGRKKKRI
jgi:hypothetical protein